MNDGSGDGTASFEVKIRMKTAKFTNMIIARFRESRYLVRESEGFRTPASKARSHCVRFLNVACTIWPKIGLGHET